MRQENGEPRRSAPTPLRREVTCNTPRPPAGHQDPNQNPGAPVTSRRRDARGANLLLRPTFSLARDEPQRRAEPRDESQAPRRQEHNPDLIPGGSRGANRIPEHPSKSKIEVTRVRGIFSPDQRATIPGVCCVKVLRYWEETICFAFI